MSRVQRKKLKVDATTGADSWEWYMRDAASDVAGWLAAIDADTMTPFTVTDVPEAEIPTGEGDFDFAVVQADLAGNKSDPATFAGWTAISLDISPPPPATGGVIEDAG